MAVEPEAVMEERKKGLAEKSVIVCNCAFLVQHEMAGLSLSAVDLTSMGTRSLLFGVGCACNRHGESESTNASLPLSICSSSRSF